MLRTMKDKDLKPLTKTEVNSLLKALPEWAYKADKIEKTFMFKSFTEAIQFVNGLVGFCNFIDHHPEIFISYKRIRFELTSHSIGDKVTERDLTVAKKIEKDFQQYKDKKVA